MAKTSAERQAAYRQRRQEEGQVHVNSLWLPSQLYAELVQESRDEGIPIRNLIIKKLYAGTRSDEDDAQPTLEDNRMTITITTEQLSTLNTLAEKHKGSSTVFSVVNVTYGHLEVELEFPYRYRYLITNTGELFECVDLEYNRYREASPAMRTTTG